MEKWTAYFRIAKKANLVMGKTEIVTIVKYGKLLYKGDMINGII